MTASDSPPVASSEARAGAPAGAGAPQARGWPGPPVAAPTRPVPTVDGPPLVAAVRDGVVESTHRAVVAVADASGRVHAAAGDTEVGIYARSAIKPAQAAGSLDVLADAGATVTLSDAALAVGAASHAGTAEHQVEVAHLLALAGLDETALACPVGPPLWAAAAGQAGVDPLVPGDDPASTRLAHNCSGKHALFLLATVAAGEDPAGYRHPAAAVQRAAARRLAALTGGEPTAPGVDGCGAPAWRVPVAGLASFAARLAAASAERDPVLARTAAAMRARPDLVGGGDAVDTALMRADARVVAKRGAEGVLVAGVRDAGAAGGGVGVAVKVVDGAGRATGPLVADLLANLGVAVPDEVRHPPVLGGGDRRGDLRVTAAVDAVRWR